MPSDAQQPFGDSVQRSTHDVELVRDALQSTQDFARDINAEEIVEVMGIAFLALKRIERRLGATFQKG